MGDRQQILQSYRSLPPSQKQQVARQMGAILRSDKVFSTLDVENMLQNKEQPPKLFHKDLQNIAQFIKDLPSKPQQKQQTKKTKQTKQSSLVKVLRGEKQVRDISSHMSEFLRLSQFGSLLETTPTVHRSIYQKLFPRLQTIVSSKIANPSQFISKLKHFTSLMVLNLNYKHLSLQDIHRLRDTLPSMKKLEKLQLANCEITADGAVALFPSFTHLTNLKILSLSYNPIGYHGSKSLAEALPSLTKLTTLALRRCYIGRNGAKHLAHGIKELSSLTEIDMSENSYDDDAAVAVVSALQHMKMMKVILLGDILTENGVIQMTDMLRGFSHLNRLGLSGEGITDRSVQSLVSIFHELPNLEILDLEKNIGNDGVREIAKYSKHLPKLIHLSLEGPMTVSGVQDIVNTFHNLVSLDLSYNRNMGVEGIRLLLQSLHLFPHLKILGLDHTQMKSGEALYLVSSFATMQAIGRDIPEVYLEGNLFSQSITNALLQLFPNKIHF